MSITRSAIGRIAVVIVIIVILIIAGGSYLAYTTLTKGSSTSSSTSTSTSPITSVSTSTSSISSSTSASSSSSSSSQATSLTSSASSTSSSSGSFPSTLTWETIQTETYLDPAVNYDVYGPWTMINTYEDLVWYNQANTSALIPWLASNYTISPNLTSYSFNLRNGIKFADGETLNSTAVYFSFNRALLMDGSTPSSHGTQFTFDLQQLLNTNLSSSLCCTQHYNPSYVNAVLAQNFVQVTGPLSFTMNLVHPNTAFLYIMAGYNYGMILAPRYVMEQDLAMWNQSSAGYSLPYPSLTGNLTQMIHEYFLDQVATCDSGITPKGCGTTYLDGSYKGSLAGTGPFILQKFDSSSNDLTFTANPNYWGGPYQFMGGQKITPRFTTLNFNFVPSLSTRELDLQNAAKSGQAMLIDLPNTNIYDVASRSVWLNNGSLQSIQPGVSVYGPYLPLSMWDLGFSMNVTNPFTGNLYTFQPFADIRFRLAFADSVNMSDVERNVINNVGVVANDGIPPNVPPAGSHDPNLPTLYSFNPYKAASLLLDLMMHPRTQFTFVNGSTAPTGYFNNTFGCRTLNSNNQCDHPVAQSIQEYYQTGDLGHEAIETQIANVINNISSTYNMGLTVSVVPLSGGQLLTKQISDSTYVSQEGFTADYAWVISYLKIVFTPGGFWSTSNGWNLTTEASLYQQAVAASASDNLTGLVSVSVAMNAFANQDVLYLWTYYPEEVHIATSNIHPLVFMPAIDSVYYFATY